MVVADRSFTIINHGDRRTEKVMRQNLGLGKWIVCLLATALVVGPVAGEDNVTYHSFSSIVDDQGTTHISFGRGVYYSDLWYMAVSADGVGVAEKVDDSRDVGYGSYIYVHNGHVYIAYRSGNLSGDLWLASKKIGESSWTKVLVDDGGGVFGDTGYYPIIYIDQDGMFHIDYYDAHRNIHVMAKAKDPAGPFTKDDLSF